ncbi:OmpA family protein [Limobrevibacterium gyesilva]|uniref:OmpA family protein n=1 Tax=Limobrevibacterium gyesilva TaxID=2991712 RepID=A0AA41YNT5_9PROT|nr:OmpA family protein [Limobrevibacterium gyesilva]MCW3477329.1 OmpA family protein [Limobrevibacterium gyesilva]
MLLAATLLAAPAVAQAQPVTGIYIGGGVGGNYTTGTDLKDVFVNGVAVNGSTHTGGGWGPVGVASVGYGFGNGLRVELEGNWRQAHEHINGGISNGGLNAQTYGAMVNALYDFDVGYPVYPYAGAGVGYEWTRIQNVTGNIGANSVNFGSQSSSGFGTQGILGVAYPIPGAPGLSLTAEYRFLAVLSNPKFEGTVGGLPAGAKLEHQFNHAGLIGLRYNFGVTPPAPTPAPVAAPAPAPARTYLVFFDWDKADLTARARQIIAEAAQASTRVAVTRIEVSGHADRTGSAAYNQTLSLKRAQNVSAELVRLGVPQNIITVQGFGDTRPLVPTAAGVREPQNRRVEIVLK